VSGSRPTPWALALAGARAWAAARSAGTRVVLAFALTVVALPACTVTVRAPPHPDDPVPVWILDHGRHASLALPDGRGHLVAWAYGEEAWFARGEDGWWRSVPALLWPTRGTLARREVTATYSGRLLAYTLGAEAVYEIDVSFARAIQLQQELQALWDAGVDEQVDNPVFGTRCAPHPEDYWLGNNCIDVLADWLRELGCEVSGIQVVARFEVESMQPDHPWELPSHGEDPDREPAPPMPFHQGAGPLPSAAQ
jgi:hypothetical protein